MRQRSLRLPRSAFAAVCLLVAVTGPAADAPTSHPTTRGVVPITYPEYASPKRLADVQERELWSFLACADVGDRKVWFVRVSYNAREHFRADVFCAPDTIDERLSCGVFVTISNAVSLEEQERISEQLGSPWRGPAVRPYAHVAESAKTTPGEKPPPIDEHPFQLPDGVAEQDVVALADAARAAIRTDRDESDRELPVVRIEVLAKDKFRVYLGWQAGPLHGRGRYVDLTRTDDGFTASAPGIWVS